MYTWETRIRYSEVDERGFLKLPAVVDYFQDCSTFQSEDVGFGIAWLASSHRVWVVNAWQIEISRLPRVGDRIIVGTNPYEIKGFLGLRNFFLQTESGEMLVMANSVWSFLDLDKSTMERAPQEMSDAYGLGERLDMNYLPRKIPFPGESEPEKKPPVEVQTTHLDTNHHVNNGQFVHIAMQEAFGDTMPQVARLRVEYKKQAHLGDLLYPVIDRGTQIPAGPVTIALNDENGLPYCTAEITLC